MTVCTFKIANFAEMTGKVDASNCSGSQKTLSAQTPWLDAARGASRQRYSRLRRHIWENFAGGARPRSTGSHGRHCDKVADGQ